MSPRPRRSPLLLAMLAGLALALSLSASADAASRAPATHAPATHPPAVGSIGPARAVEGPPPDPQLLIFHGGAFLFEDPTFEASVAEYAVEAGFVPHFVNYPLGNMPAAVLTARAEARTLRQQFGIEHVYAYGASAGGTLAALLAGDGLISAAVAKAPVSDLLTWEWPVTEYGSDFYEKINLDPAARYRLSPIDRKADSPLLIYQGREDQVVPPEMNEAFAAEFPEQIKLWSVVGGHATERVRPWLVQMALHWLAGTAEKVELEAMIEDEEAKFK